MNVRTYSSRTAATNYLRAQGIAAADYNAHLSTKGDKFVVTLENEAPTKVKLPLETNVVVVGTGLKGELTVEAAHADQPKVEKREAAKPVKGSAASAKKQSPSSTKSASSKPAKGAKETPHRRAGDKPMPISQRCLQFFQAGKDNAYVWSVLQAEYGLDEDKAHYPAWYRSHFRRKGVLPTASAVAKKGKK